MEGFLGFDIGGTNLRCGLLNELGEIVAFYKEPTEAKKGVDAIIRKISALIEKAKRDHPEIKLLGVGIGIAGILRPKEGIVCFSPNLPGWRNIPLVALLKEAQPNLPIFIENDANLIALGEGWQGAGKGKEDFFLLTLGTGVGGGIVYQGHLLSGYSSAAEIGHMKIDPKGIKCLCGRRGCLETFASAGWLVRRAKKHLKTGMPSLLSRKKDFTAKDVFTAAQRGDILATYLFSLAGWALGIGIANLCNILGFTTAIIGGGMSDAWDMFIGRLKETLMHELIAVEYEKVEILKTTLGDMAGIYGACYLVKIKI